MLSYIISIIPEGAYTTESENVVKMITEANKRGIKRRENLEKGRVIYQDADLTFCEVQGTLTEEGRSIIVEDENFNQTKIARCKIVAIAKIDGGE